MEEEEEEKNSRPDVFQKSRPDVFISLESRFLNVTPRICIYLIEVSDSKILEFSLLYLHHVTLNNAPVHFIHLVHYSQDLNRDEA